MRDTSQERRQPEGTTSAWAHGAAWVIAAVSITGLLLLPARHVHTGGRMPELAPPTCLSADARLDRHEFEEQVPSERPECKDEEIVVALTL